MPITIDTDFDYTESMERPQAGSTIFHLRIEPLTLLQTTASATRVPMALWSTAQYQPLRELKGSVLFFERKVYYYVLFYSAVSPESSKGQF